MRTALPVIAALLALGLAGHAAAGPPCKDARGKFIKCPAAAAAKPARCKDARGKFTRCGAPGSTPA